MEFCALIVQAEATPSVENNIKSDKILWNKYTKLAGYSRGLL